jgi:hypothetical protein
MMPLSFVFRETRSNPLSQIYMSGRIVCLEGAYEGGKALRGETRERKSIGYWYVFCSV